MKLLHTADLHLGKRFNEFSMIEDQEQVLQEIRSIAKQEAVDGIIIAGDVFQSTYTTGEALKLFDRFITDLSKDHFKVFLISGNHDSEKRISYMSELLQISGVYATRMFDGKLQSVVVRDEYGDLEICMLPFIKPIVVQQFYPGEDTSTYQKAIELVLNRSDAPKADRRLLVCHQFISGSSTCESEEKQVGTVEAVSADLFAAFDFVAMGHIHGPQDFVTNARGKQTTLSYAGSPLKYSFSEQKHQKSVNIITFGETGKVPELKKVPLSQPHQVRHLKGKLEDIQKEPSSEDLLWITLTDELVHPDAHQMLRERFPNILSFNVENEETKKAFSAGDFEITEDLSPEELFKGFYETVTQETLSEREAAIMNEIMEEVKKEEEKA